jgi:hypothetical protein
MARLKHDGIQIQGFEKADRKEYSAAIRLFDEALQLKPRYAVLHEMKAQVKAPQGSQSCR